MSTPSLNMLVRLMIAQVQECVFENVMLAGVKDEFLMQLQSAQEAARVRPFTLPVSHAAYHLLLMWESMTKEPLDNELKAPGFF